MGGGPGPCSSLFLVWTCAVPGSRLDSVRASGTGSAGKGRGAGRGEAGGGRGAAKRRAVGTAMTDEGREPSPVMRAPPGAAPGGGAGRARTAPGARPWRSPSSSAGGGPRLLSANKRPRACQPFQQSRPASPSGAREGPFPDLKGKRDDRAPTRALWWVCPTGAHAWGWLLKEPTTTSCGSLSSRLKCRTADSIRVAVHRSPDTARVAHKRRRGSSRV